jgi:hypothetical protein
VSFADPFALGALFGPVRAHDREVAPRAPPEKAHPSLGLDESHPAFSCDCGEETAHCVAARSDGVGEDGESRKVRRSREKREVMSYAKSPADACAPSTVFSAHHVRELSLDLWSRRAVAAFPFEIALTFSLPVEDVVCFGWVLTTRSREESVHCARSEPPAQLAANFAMFEPWQRRHCRAARDPVRGCTAAQPRQPLHSQWIT